MYRNNFPAERTGFFSTVTTFSYLAENPRWRAGCFQEFFSGSSSIINLDMKKLQRAFLVILKAPSNKQRIFFVAITLNKVTLELT